MNAAGRSVARAAVVAAALVSMTGGRETRAEGPPAAAIGATGHPTARPEGTGSDRAAPGVSNGGGLMLGVGLALAALGAGVVLARGGLGARAGAAGGLQVVGRAALGPGQAAHLVRVGDRLLVVGTGRGGAPRLLAELDADAAQAPGPPPRPTGGER